MIFIETAIFTADLPSQLGDLRKIRWAAHGKGKSGGVLCAINKGWK
jgi:hypothetical protein